MTHLRSFGEVRGTLKAINHNLTHCCLFVQDEIFDCEVHCWVNQSKCQCENYVRFIGKDIVVSGIVTYDTLSALPLRVRNIESIELILTVPHGSYERARGVWDMGTAEPETLLRKMRDRQ